MKYIAQRRRSSGPRLVSAPQPWQADPPFPSRIVIYLSHHHLKSLPAPAGREVIQRNGRVWIAERCKRVAKLDAAQYHMLLATCENQDDQSVPTEQTLNRISDSCRAQNDADLGFFVHWSRHLVVSTMSELLNVLIGASAVSHNPPFSLLCVPVLTRIVTRCTFRSSRRVFIDSFAPHLRRQMLEKALAHDSVVWVLRQDKGNPDDPDLTVLNMAASLYAELPKKSLVVHRPECWEAAAWDVELSRYSTKLWRLHNSAIKQQPDP